MMLWGFFLPAHDVRAMSLDQMKALAGTGLLGLRVDEVFHRCGLPAAIADSADSAHKKRPVRWGDVSMALSSMEWDLLYGRQHADARKPDWANAGPAGGPCLSDLSELVVHAKGERGVLSVRKRADKQGYVTTYQVPDNPYAAHQVVEVTGRWMAAMAVSGLHERYGKPDEILSDRGRQIHRYWVVEKNNQQMPISLHAVDFEIDAGGKTTARYVVQSDGIEFVQQKLDALLRQWEKDYVLD